MKIFDQVPPWPNKVNFVDDDNTVVGYDMEQSCCERAGWFICYVPTTNTDTETPPILLSGALDAYKFNTHYFCEEPDPRTEVFIARFRLHAPDRPALYLHLFNCHNGWYGHGFEMRLKGLKGDIIREGIL
jgi:hypothetical protein